MSEENLAAIRKRGGQYLVGTPRSQMIDSALNGVSCAFTSAGSSGQCVAVGDAGTILARNL